MSLAVLIPVVEVDAPLVENRSQFFSPTVSISKPRRKRGAPRRAGPSRDALRQRQRAERIAALGPDYVVYPPVAVSAEVSAALSLQYGLDGLSREDLARVLETILAEVAEKKAH